jgi:Tfp pilus assembly protein PilF
MEKSRVEKLEEFLRKDPTDSFSRYGLALEYMSQGKVAAAIAHLQKLIELDPDYIATYMQLGQAYEKTSRIEEAKKTYQLGIDACARKGNTKTKDELAFALEQLSDSF